MNVNVIVVSIPAFLLLLLGIFIAQSHYKKSNLIFY